MECIKAYTLIHCVLERSVLEKRLCLRSANSSSDILTELDAFPSQSQHTLNRYWPTPFHTTEVESNIPTGETDITPFIQGHLFLRDTLNRILHDLYSPDNANAAPHELGDLVDSFSTKVRQWSRGLPFDHQFAQDITTFTMSGQSLSMRQVRDSMTLENSISWMGFGRESLLLGTSLASSFYTDQFCTSTCTRS